MFLHMLRKFWLVLTAKFRPRMAGMGEEVVHRFRCLPFDLDENIHMNNSRYLLYLEMGRWDMMVRTGFLKYAVKHKVFAPVSNVEIVYRRSLQLFQKFEVRTRICRWTENAIYFDQRFFSRGELVAVAVAECRVAARGGGTSLSQIVRELGMDPGDAFDKLVPAVSQLNAIAKDLLKS